MSDALTTVIIAVALAGGTVNIDVQPKTRKQKKALKRINNGNEILYKQMCRMQTRNFAKSSRNFAAGIIRLLELHGKRKADAGNQGFCKGCQRQD